MTAAVRRDQGHRLDRPAAHAWSGEAGLGFPPMSPQLSPKRPKVNALPLHAFTQWSKRRHDAARMSARSRGAADRAAHLRAPGCADVGGKKAARAATTSARGLRSWIDQVMGIELCTRAQTHQHQQTSWHIYRDPLRRIRPTRKDADDGTRTQVDKRRGSNGIGDAASPEGGGRARLHGCRSGALAVQAGRHGPTPGRPPTWPRPADARRLRSGAGLPLASKVHSAYQSIRKQTSARSRFPAPVHTPS